MGTIENIKREAAGRARDTFLDMIQEKARDMCKEGEEYQLLNTRYSGVAWGLMRDVVSGHVVKVHNVHMSPTYMERAVDYEIDMEGDDIIINGGSK